MPRRMRGDWALPDCRTYHKALIITRHFYLQISKDHSQLRAIAPMETKNDYLVMPVAGVIRPVKVTADGQLTIGILDGKTPKRWPHRWRGLKINDRREYMGCAIMPTILPPLLVHVMAHIDRIARICHAGMTAACGRLLFAVADQNRDGKISKQEMKSAAVMLGDVALLAKHHGISQHALAKENKTALREAARLAQRFMPNGSGMTYADFDGFLKKAQSKRFDAALKDIGGLIPGFRE